MPTESQAARGLNFSLLATPAEGLSGRFVRMDAKPASACIPGVTDREYYTNSLPCAGLLSDLAPLTRSSMEAPYHALTNARPYQLY